MNHLPGMNLGLLGSNVGMRQQFIPSQQPTYSQMMGQSNMGIRSMFVCLCMLDFKTFLLDPFSSLIKNSYGNFALSPFI